MSLVAVRVTGPLEIPVVVGCVLCDAPMAIRVDSPHVVSRCANGHVAMPEGTTYGDMLRACWPGVWYPKETDRLREAMQNPGPDPIVVERADIVRATVVQSRSGSFLVSIRADDGRPIQEALTAAGFRPGEAVEIRRVKDGQ